MEPITLEQLKAMPISDNLAAEIQRLGTEMHGNMRIDQRELREGDEYDRDRVAFNMTHDGNEPKTIRDILDEARLYIHYDVFTDEEWESFLLPYINREIARQRNFKRWMPGYVIRHKQTGRLAIVKGDYAYEYGGRDFTSLHVCDLNADGRVVNSWAWAQYGDYELVDEDHVLENIKKMAGFSELRL